MQVLSSAFPPDQILLRKRSDGLIEAILVDPGEQVEGTYAVDDDEPPAPAELPGDLGEQVDQEQADRQQEEQDKRLREIFESASGIAGRRRRAAAAAKVAFDIEMSKDLDQLEEEAKDKEFRELWRLPEPKRGGGRR
jgi:type IV secretory pathway VirB10-like protein